MKNRSVKRWTALALTLVMALSLAVPVMGATPMMEAGEAMAETPVVEGVGAMPGHSHVATPDLDKAEVSATSSEDYVHNVTEKGTTSTFYSFKNAAVAYPGNKTKLTGDYAGYTKGVLVKTDGDISFTAPNDGTLRVTIVRDATSSGTLRVGYTLPGASKKTDKPKMSTNPCVMEVSVVGNVAYSLGGDNGDMYVLKLEFVPSIPACDVHTWGPLSEDTATCTEPGTQTQTCTVCGEQETFDTEPTGHTPVPQALIPI